MNDPVSGGSEFSDEYSASHYSDYESDVSVQSTLADLLERFTIDAKPECTLKLRSQAGPLIVGADLTHVTGTKSNICALVLKPSNTGQPWRRLRMDSSGTVTLRSRKLQWWVFTLDVIGHANPFSRTCDLSYRVATKWDLTRGEYRNKRRLPLGDKTEGRVHWTISYSLPAIEGSMGTAAQRSLAREVHADMGYAHLDIPRAELVVWPRGKPLQHGSSAAAAAAEEDAHGMDAPAARAASSAPVLDAAAAWDGAEARSSFAGGAAGDLPQGFAQQQQQQQHGQGGGASSSGGGQTGSSSGGSGRQQQHQASLQQLSSHVASISGRWWDAYEAGAGGSRAGLITSWNRPRC